MRVRTKPPHIHSDSPVSTDRSIMNDRLNKSIGNRLPISFKSNRVPDENTFNFTQSTFKKGDQVRNKKSGHIAIVSGKKIWNKKYLPVIILGVYKYKDHFTNKITLWSIENVELVNL